MRVGVLQISSSRALGAKVYVYTRGICEKERERVREREMSFSINLPLTAESAFHSSRLKLSLLLLCPVTVLEGIAMLFPAKLLEMDRIGTCASSLTCSASVNVETRGRFCPC